MLVEPVNCPSLSLSLWHCALWPGNPLHTQLQFSIPIIAAGPWWFRAGQAPLLLDNANDYIRANWMGPGGDEHLGSNMQYWGSSTVICCGVRVLFLFEVWTSMVEQLTCRSVWFCSSRSSFGYFTQEISVCVCVCFCALLHWLKLAKLSWKKVVACVLSVSEDGT